MFRSEGDVTVCLEMIPAEALPITAQVDPYQIAETETLD